MIQSMTGYGKSKAINDNISLQVEIKTLNSKNIDINLRLPNDLRALELPWRRQISTFLKRGKVDVFVNYEKNGNKPPVIFNKEIIRNYISELKELSNVDEHSNAKLLEIALTLPNTTTPIEEDEIETDKTFYSNCLQEAIHNVIEFRKKEGENLEKDIKNNLLIIQEKLNIIKEIDDFRKTKTREKLQNALQELSVEYDKNRFEQELIYYIEKFDISEEKTRLQSHLDYFSNTIESTQPNGKKLNFISQEMGREINTIGSKANDAQLQNIVVVMKDQLEKIKEQLLNIL